VTTGGTRRLPADERYQRHRARRRGSGPSSRCVESLPRIPAHPHPRRLSSRSEQS
jgi:hypothetical protein